MAHDIMFSNDTYKQTDDIVHGDTDMEDTEEKDEIIPYDLMITIMRVLMFGVTPAISILGVGGNIFSIIILLKHGLHKCSNILLISLAVADLMFLVAFNSVPKILYEVVGIDHGYGYIRDVSLVLFVFFNVFNITDYATNAISLTLPMLITFERLVAVYLPFKFNLIITPVRTWCTVAVVYLFWFSAYVYMSFWLTLTHTFDPHYNISVGRMERSSVFYNSPTAVKVLEECLNYMVMKIPPIVTLVGCIFISVKVRVAAKRRQEMTQGNTKDASSNRTTKMLLTVCVMYMITCALISMPSYLPQYVQYSVYSEPPHNLSPVMYQIINIAACINSSANFIVYVVMNKNFRDTYKSLFNSCRGQKL